MRWSRQIATVAVAATFAFGTTVCSEKQPTAPREAARVAVGAGGFQPPVITVTQRDSVAWSCSRTVPRKLSAGSVGMGSRVRLQRFARSACQRA